jgi:hypothetical protein
MICLRSIAWAIAALTFLLSSSRCEVFRGFELMMKSVWSTPGVLRMLKLLLSVLMAVPGTASIASISCDNIRSPKASTFGFSP